jgi:hypothetical protein
MLDGIHVRRAARDAGDGADDRRRDQVVQNCHMRWQCAVVRPVFARYHNYGSSGGVRWFSGRGGQGSRHASLYPPLRRRSRTILHDLSKL